MLVSRKLNTHCRLCKLYSLKSISKHCLMLDMVVLNQPQSIKKRLLVTAINIRELTDWLGVLSYRKQSVSASIKYQNLPS